MLSAITSVAYRQGLVLLASHKEVYLCNGKNIKKSEQH